MNASSTDASQAFTNAVLLISSGLGDHTLLTNMFAGVHKHQVFVNAPKRLWTPSVHKHPPVCVSTGCALLCTHMNASTDRHDRSPASRTYRKPQTRRNKAWTQLQLGGGLQHGALPAVSMHGRAHRLDFLFGEAALALRRFPTRRWAIVTMD